VNSGTVNFNEFFAHLQAGNVDYFVGESRKLGGSKTQKLQQNKSLEF
jgi:hypothetical protein